MFGVENRVLDWTGLRRLMPRPRERIYDRICDAEVLTRAWKSVRRVHTAGVDGMTVRAFEADWPRNMADLAQCLRERSYHPLPLRRFLVAGTSGRQREVAVLTLRDRIVQRAVYEVVLPRFEAIASRFSYAYRPGLSREDAIERLVALRLEGNYWILNADISAFFDEIDCRRAIRTFERVVGDQEVTALVREWLEIGAFRPEGIASAAVSATAADRAMSPLWGAEAGRIIDALPELAVRVRRAIEAAMSGVEGREPGPLQSGGRSAEGWVQALLPLVVAARGPLSGLTHGRSLGGAANWGRIGAGAATVGGLALFAWGFLPLVAQVARGAGTGRGVPQGSVLSPLLANAYLAEFDRTLEHRALAFARYSDNIAVATRRQEDATRARAIVEEELARVGLRLSQAKTEITPYDAGFTFLGQGFPVYRRQATAGGPVLELARDFAGSVYWRARQRATA